AVPAPAAYSEGADGDAGQDPWDVLAQPPLDPLPLLFFRQIIFHSCLYSWAARAASPPAASPWTGHSLCPDSCRSGFVATTPRARWSSHTMSARAAPLRPARRNCALKLPPPRFSSNRRCGSASRNLSTSPRPAAAARVPLTTT